MRQLTATKKENISRGELVQIGGGFRIPDILETSDAALREIGTTNRTNLEVMLKPSVRIPAYCRCIAVIFHGRLCRLARPP